MADIRRTICFSSFTYSYLDRATVLFKSIRQFHPEWKRVALITDVPPPGAGNPLDPELFEEVVFARDLGIEDFERWLFQHDIVEVSTAVKGPFLASACRSGADQVIYLDPDTCLFARLDSVVNALQGADIALTPHQLQPDSARTAIIDNEITSLMTGIYNLGFLAINTRGDGARFADWWSRRLLEFCHDDIPRGLFVDQRWCDHVPSFFERTSILRDPGLNVASWNLSQRKVTFDRSGNARVNGQILRFWHFTKLGPTGDVMTRRYARDNWEVYEIWNWYRRNVLAARGDTDFGRYWAYGQFSDGTPIARDHRLLFRQRADLRAAFPHPFTAGAGSYLEWLIHEGRV